MRLKRILILAASALSFGVNAQTTIQIGAGATINGIGPFGGVSNENLGTLRVMHYTQSELSNNAIFPGTHITAIKWYKANNVAYTTDSAAKATLYIRSISPAYPTLAYATGPINIEGFITDTIFTAVDTVYFGTSNNLPNADWVGFDGFDYIFTGEELEVFVKFEVLDPGSLPDPIVWKSGTISGTEEHFLMRDGAYTVSTDFTSELRRPNTQITFSGTGTPVCPTTVLGGNAVLSVATTLPGTLISIDADQNYTNIPGLTTYIWESAPASNGPWTTISTVLTNPYFEFNAPNDNTHYRLKVECGSGSAYSGYAYLEVTPTCPQVVVPGIASSNANSPLCPGTNFELDITGNTYVAGSSTFTWESAPSASGPWSTYSNPLSLPIIGLSAPNATTWYRAKVECGGNEAYTNEVEVAVVVGPSGSFTINNALPTGGGNFQNFADAVASLNCGISGDVIFNVEPGSGPYNEQVIIGNIATSATATVTFNGNGATLNHISDNDNELAVIKLNGADYVTFRNFKITVEGTDDHGYGCGVQMLNDADHNTIDSCEVEVIEAQSSLGNSSYAGIVVNGNAVAIEDGTNSYCDHNQILNNIVKNGYYGIVFWGPGNGDMMSNNIAKGNFVLDFYSKGIMYLNSEDGLAEGNNISRPTRATSGNFFGIEIAGSISMKINSNRVHDPAAAEPTFELNAVAINIINANPGNNSKNTVSNNLVYNFISNGGSMGVQLENSKNLNIYHNTISLEHQNTSCIGCMGVYGIYQKNVAATKLDIKNNIITLDGQGGGQKHMLHFEQAPMNSVLDNNDYYFADGATNTAIGYMDGDDYETMEDWQQAVFGEQNSLMLNPMYEDAANGNFKPAKDSLDNKGTYVNIDVDIMSAARNASTPDIGAYEFEVEVTFVKNAKKVVEAAIYPNPATDYINIISAEKVDVQVMSMDGRIVSEQSNAVKVDMRNLAEGNYILKILNREGAVIKTDKVFKVSK